MKHIFLSLAFFITLFICFPSFGQLEQGTFVVNERFDFYTTSSENDDFGSNTPIKNKNTQYSLTTSFGYLIKENQELGITLLFGRDKITQNYSFQGGSNEDTNIDQTYGVGVYYKRYVNIVEKLSFFVSPEFSYSNTKLNTQLSSGNMSKRNGLGLNLYTGLLYRPTQKFGLSMNLVGAGINYYSVKTPIGKENTFSFSDFGNFNLSVQFMF